MTRPWPQVGDTICDCWHQHHTITDIITAGLIRLDNGFIHSLAYCAHPADHPEHTDMPPMPDGWNPVCAHYTDNTGQKGHSPR